MLAAVCALATQPAKQEPRKGPAKVARKADTPAPGSTTIPKDAEQVEPGIWRHADEKGKVWHYRRTPFGMAKYEPEPEAENSAADLAAFDEGEKVRFERRTPFGVSRWTRLKSELSGDELTAYKRLAAKTAKAVKE
ncbi:MAG: hypothetical protein FJW20_13715 [Acidimicrobiia bacterium]|nr:hypothetical protein [Acidimicrobiia bacterium]